MTANHIARMTAKRLMPKFGDGLPRAVENLIQSETTEPGQFIGVVEAASVAMLIVQCAQFAYERRRTKQLAEKSDVEALKHELRLLTAQVEDVSEKMRGEVIDVVAEEVERKE
jgi:hypothetical protein